jgi:hypothetical protein
MAQQDFECIAEPRFGYTWRRETREDGGYQFYTVDGCEVTDLDEAACLLAAPPDAEGPRTGRPREIGKLEASPKLKHGATRALSEAKCNVNAGPFGTIRAWLKRIDTAWHQGINTYTESQRKAGAKFDDYSWLHDAKRSVHEAFRLIYLFADDRKTDTELVCALGARCRECPILVSIEAAMIKARDNPRSAIDIDDADIAAAKAWTCISHILRSGTRPYDGVFVASYRDRRNAINETTRWAQIAKYKG